jgi:methionine aminotransferase
MSIVEKMMDSCTHLNAITHECAKSYMQRYDKIDAAPNSGKQTLSDPSHLGQMIRSKLPDTATSIFTVMSALATRHGAINLSQGFPDFEPDERLLELYGRALTAGQGFNQYAPMQGIPELRALLAKKILSLYECQVDPDTEITITAGGTQAIFTAAAAIIHPGDEAIILDPAYDCYAPVVKMLGGLVRTIGLRAPEFQIDWDQVEKAISPKARVIFINTPHNPVGRAWSAEDIQALEQIVTRHGIFVISDEVYEHVIFDGIAHQSILRSEILSKHSFAVYSFGKLIHATGWKAGYCVAPAELMTEFRKVHQFNVFSVNRPVQHALEAYLEDPENYIHLPEFFQKKRDFFLSEMVNTQFQFLPCQGSYFILADYSAVSDLDDMTFAERLTIDHGVATIPLSPFYTNPTREQRLVRFCFAKKDETLSKAAEHLRQVEHI